MYISEITNEMPSSYTSDLEKRVYEKLNELNIVFDRVDNDTVESMEECVEISDKLGAEIRKTIIVCNETGIDDLIKKNKTGLCINYTGEDFIKIIKKISKDQKKLFEELEDTDMDDSVIKDFDKFTEKMIDKNTLW